MDFLQVVGLRRSIRIYRSWEKVEREKESELSGQTSASAALPFLTSEQAFRLTYSPNARAAATAFSALGRHPERPTACA